MVNGKPQLTFGGQIVKPAKASRRLNLPAKSPSGKDFASYLPQGTGKAPLPAQSLQKGMPSLPGKGLTPGGYPESSLYANTQPTPPNERPATHFSSRQASTPPVGEQTLPAARMALGRTSGRTRIRGSERSSRRSSPRISGQPVTGRGDIGMTDPRRQSSMRRSTLAARGDISYASPTANAARAQSLGKEFSGRESQATRASYATFLDGFRGSGQSFVTHGFASKHARSALKKAGFERSDTVPVKTTARLLDPEEYAPRAQAAAHTPENGRAVRPRPEQSAVHPAARRTNQFRTPEPVAVPVRPATQHKVLPMADTSPQAVSATNTGKLQGGYPARSLVPAFHDMARTNLGALAAKFESGAEGIAAIGYDRKGGTSYGKYQISSRAGTMDGFIAYLSEHAPELARRLEDAGPANTGRRTGKMPAVWREIAAEQPDRFEALQSEFIRTSHFEPALQSIADSTGIGLGAMPHALQEVLFSTAVQHGPAGAVRIVSKALNRVSKNKLMNVGAEVGESFKQAGRQLIQQIYALRAGQFTSSTARVQAAVRNRLQREMREALQMLT